MESRLDCTFDRININVVKNARAQRVYSPLYRLHASGSDDNAMPINATPTPTLEFTAFSNDDMFPVVCSDACCIRRCHMPRSAAGDAIILKNIVYSLQI